MSSDAPEGGVGADGPGPSRADPCRVEGDQIAVVIPGPSGKTDAALNSVAPDPLQSRRRSRRVADAAVRKLQDATTTDVLDSDIEIVSTNERGVGTSSSSRQQRVTKVEEDAEDEIDPMFRHVTPVQSAPAALDGVPYHVKLHPCASAVVQFDAHMTMNEVCGYLAGVIYDLPSPVASENNEVSQNVDAEPQSRKVVHILAAFPVVCTSAAEMRRQGRNALVEVEMDPESQLSVSERILSLGMVVAGWYHSHPEFCPEPSVLDVENHASHQCHAAYPHLALICSTYWSALPDSRAKLDMFYTRCVDGDNVPYDLPYEVTLEPPACVHGTKEFYGLLQGLSPNNTGVLSTQIGDVVRVLLVAQQRQLLVSEAHSIMEKYASHSRKVRLHTQWYSGKSHLEKLQESLRSTLHICPEGSALAVPSLSRVGVKQATGSKISDEDDGEYREVRRGLAPASEVGRRDAADLFSVIDDLLGELNQVSIASSARGRGGRRGRGRGCGGVTRTGKRKRV